MRRSRRAATTAAVGAGGGAGGAGNPTGSTYWPWDTGGDPADSTGSGVLPAVQEPVPGRRSQRAGIVMALLVLVLVAAVVAYNLGRGRTPLGAEPEAAATPTPSASPDSEPVAVEGLTASLLDPQGGGSEDADEAPLAEDALSDLQQLNRLRQALDRMDERCRELLTLIFADEDEKLPYEEVAVRLQMPVGSIGPTRARCLQKLRRLVEGPAAANL